MLWYVVILVGVFFPLLFSGCQTHGLVLYQQKIDGKYLASANVGSPDPRPSPSGQMLVAEWWIPRELVDKSPKLVIEIMFADLSEKKLVFPIDSRFGYIDYQLIGKEFTEKRGFLSYRAQIVAEEEGGEILFDEWTHQLWVKLICA